LRVTKLRPGLQTMTRAAVIFMAWAFVLRLLVAAIA
jgi:hypothetical protein